MTIKRSRYCGEIRASDVDQEIALCGWVDRWRDHGGVVFIDLRDRTGIAQVVFDPEDTAIPQASGLRQEFVVGVRGKVRRRPEGMANSKLPTGEVEIIVRELEIFNAAQTLPYSLHDDSPTQGEVDETLRLKHRYLELRRPGLQHSLRLRHRFLKSARDYYSENGFWEIETPILYKSTPEGARDYLVPSRIHPGQFYALPQSPQTLKQLCMIGGLDRYVQIARCFRDEDLRADRQPEFTQIDVEMSFVDEADVMSVHEGLMKRIFHDVLDVNIETPFRRLPYAEAIARYGSDKPDLRNPLELVTLTEQGKRTTFQVYLNALSSGAILKGLCIEEKEPIPRSELDALPSKVAPFGAKGITWIRIKGPGDWQSPQAKFFDPALKAEIESKLPFKPPALLLMLCDRPGVVNGALSALRQEYGARLGYSRSGGYELAWITDFPLFEYNEEDKRFYAAHHPFTSPATTDLPALVAAGPGSDLRAIGARAYDLVLNGYEVGGGSIRIHDPQVQAQMFRLLGISEEEAQLKFGFFLKALQYGTPPHGGIALGVDRIAMVLAGTDAIRDVIAFPKTQKASCLMSEAPSPVNPAQLAELKIRVTLPKE